MFKSKWRKKYERVIKEMEARRDFLDREITRFNEKEEKMTDLGLDKSVCIIREARNAQKVTLNEMIRYMKQLEKL